jgi:eukaryotic-like serine/threonine-protein kinase
MDSNAAGTGHSAEGEWQMQAEQCSMENDQTQLHGTSVILLERFRDGDELAAEALFSRYFERLTSLARNRLSARLASRADPEDIVMSVYRSFFIGARAGRFDIGGAGDLWRLLASITKHKLLRQIRHHGAGRRSVNVELPFDEHRDGRFPGRQPDPSPEEAIALADELEWVLSQFDSVGRRVLELRLQGAELTEIARDTGCSERTVRRILARTREVIGERFRVADDDRETRVLQSEQERQLNEPRRNVLPNTRSSSSAAGAEARRDGPLLSHRDILLQRMIGSGRMGKVYQARRLSENRTVAVKFLRKSFLNHPGVVERFIGEARTIAKLDHPHIVSIHGLGGTTGGAYFIVMDFIAGSNLDQIIKARTVSVHEAVDWVIQVCQALEHAHKRGIIHCDLNPANILLDERGRIRVTDFGLARSLTGHTPWTTEVEGTAPFMAPEQASRSWGEIDVRTDVYGIGAVLYTLLTGRPPWEGRRLPDVLANVISAAVVVPARDLRADLPEWLSDLCAKSLSKKQRERYPKVEDVRVDLAASAGRNPQGVALG